MISVDEFIRLETCIHGWWSCGLFRLLADGFCCRLLWDDILVDQSLPVTALSPYYGHSLVFVCRSLSSSASPAYVYAEGLLRGRWVECFLVIFFGCGSSYFTQWGCVLLAPATSLLGLFSVYVICSCVFFASSFKDCEAGAWLCLFLRDFDLLDLFSLVISW